jgi:hypothetical protein
MWKALSILVIVLLGLRLGGIKVGGGLMLCGLLLLWMDRFLRDLGKTIDEYPGANMFQKTRNWLKAK